MHLLEAGIAQRLIQGAALEAILYPQCNSLFKRVLGLFLALSLREDIEYGAARYPDASGTTLDGTYKT